MRSIVVLVVVLAVGAAPAYGRPGDLDRGFANGGRIAYKMYGQGGWLAGLALPDGRRPLLSVDASRDGASAPRWMRLTSTGRLRAREVISPPATKAPEIASGYAVTRLSPQPWRYRLAPLGGGPSTTLELPGNLVGTSFVVDRRGRVIVTAFPDQPPRKASAMRFLPTGQLDPTYGEGGVAVLDALEFGRDLVLRRDGRVYVSDGDRMMALDANGQPLRGFAQGYIVGTAARFVAIDVRGRIVVAGVSYDDALREDERNAYPAIARLQS